MLLSRRPLVKMGSMPPLPTTPRVAVVGGSLGGLTTALVLRDAGCDVTVYERSAMELAGLGAGIVVQEATVRYLIERLGMGLEDISVAARVLQYLGPDDQVTFSRPSPYRFTAWNTVYRALIGALGEGSYRRGHALVGFAQDAGGVDVRFANGATDRVDLLVCVDGVASTARKRLLPEVEPRYSGYVGWRGTVTESLLSRETFELLSDAITYGLAPNSHIVAYQIPSVQGGMGAGERLVNFVWYRNVTEGAELDELMTDREGLPRPLSLHPGIVQQRYVDAIKATAEQVLSGALAEMVVRTPLPFVQTIVDVEVPRMVFGRVCLMGDAAFTARPHAAAGTAKAAQNGWALASALTEAACDIDAALAAWEPEQLALGRQLVARTRDVGERSQFHGNWVPGDPDLRFGLFAPGR
jgi:2,6-dihydroxypyridine 3-monooxygenase